MAETQAPIEAPGKPASEAEVLANPVYREIMQRITSIYRKAGVSLPSAIPNPAQQLLAIIDGLYVRQGVEVSIIAGSVSSIGDLLHYLLNFPLKTPEDVLLRMRAWDYLAEAAAMTPYGPQILQSIVKAMDDALKLNVSLAMERSGGFNPAAGPRSSFDEKKPQDGKRGQFESATFEPKGDK
jgi:hypothetical protein